MAYLDAMCSWHARIDKGNCPALMALLNLQITLKRRTLQHVAASSWSRSKLMRRVFSRFHVGSIGVSKARVIADGERALGAQSSLDAVDNEEGVMLLGQVPCGVVEFALQALSRLPLAHHGFHIQRFNMHLVFLRGFKCGFERVNVVGNDHEREMAVCVLEARQVLLVRFSAAVAESRRAITVRV